MDFVPCRDWIRYSAIEVRASFYQHVLVIIEKSINYYHIKTKLFVTALWFKNFFNFLYKIVNFIKIYLIYIENHRAKPLIEFLIHYCVDLLLTNPLIIYIFLKDHFRHFCYFCKLMWIWRMPLSI